MSTRRLTKQQKAEIAYLDEEIRAMWRMLGGLVCDCGQLAVHGSTMCGTCAAKLL
jgi:hypothetical protein